jgi:hypothetical protein
MLRTIERVYRNGKVELTEVPKDMCDETRILVMFLKPQPIDLRASAIDEAHASEWCARPAMFAANWDSPEMAVCDDYDLTNARLRPRGSDARARSSDRRKRDRPRNRHFAYV